MHRIDGTGHVAGMFTEGDPLVPTAPTQITDDWLNAVQEEIVNVCTAGGVPLSKEDNDQLLRALEMRFLNVSMLREMVLSDVADMTAFYVATRYQMGAAISKYGDISHYGPQNGAHTYMYSVNVNLPSPATVVFNVIGVDDSCLMYVDGVLAHTFTLQLDSVLQTYSHVFTAGNHIVKFMIKNGGDTSFMYLGSWIDGTIVKYVNDGSY